MNMEPPQGPATSDNKSCTKVVGPQADGPSTPRKDVHLCVDRHSNRKAAPKTISTSNPSEN